MQPAVETGHRLALLVATSAYGDPDLRQLRSPGHDADQLAAVLRDPQIGGFDVRVLINPASGEVQEGIEDFCTDRYPDDQLLIYLSCHGVLDSHGRLYYAAANTRRQRLAATAVAAAWLNERLEDCRARRQILVLDCCHSGAFAKGAKGDADLALQRRFEPHGRGRVVLTASRSTEYSFEGGQASGEGVPSVFTNAVVNGLRTGDADRDEDGLITVNDLYQYVFESVRAVEPRQTPELWTYGAEGNLLVAHSVRGAVVEPEPLPEDLRVTLESPRRRVRETGVGELADLLDTARPGLVLTARQALERIAEEDHPQVAALARIAINAPAGTAAEQVGRELTDRAHREQLERQEAARKAEEAAHRQAEEQARRDAGPGHGGEDAGDIPAATLTGVANVPEDAPSRDAAEHEVAAAALDRPAPTMPPAYPPPKLVLSATAIDLGRLPQLSASPEYRVRIDNAGGGELNLRAATPESWLKLHQTVDALLLAVDTSAAGEFEGTVTVESDGGTGAIRVHAQVEPTTLTVPETVRTSYPEQVPEAQANADGGPQQDSIVAIATTDSTAPLDRTSIETNLVADQAAVDREANPVNVAHIGPSATYDDQNSHGPGPGEQVKPELPTKAEIVNVSGSTNGWSSRAKRNRIRVWLLITVALVVATATVLVISMHGGGGPQTQTSGGGSHTQLTGSPTAVLKNPRYKPEALAFGSGAKTLAIGSINNDGSIGTTYIWDIATRKVTATLTDPGGQGVYSVAFGPGGTTLAAGGNDGSTYLWDISTRKVIAALPDPGGYGVFSVAFGPGGTTLAAGDSSGSTYLWDISTRKVTATLPNPGGYEVSSVAFGPGGTTLAAGARNGGGSTYLWDISTRKVIAALSDPGGLSVQSVAFGPGGTTLAAGDSNGSTYLWDISTRKVTATLSDPGGLSVQSVAFGPGGTTLAAGDSNGSTYLWDISTRKVTATLSDPGGHGVQSVAFGPGGTTLAAGDSNGSTYLWNPVNRTS